MICLSFRGPALNRTCSNVFMPSPALVFYARRRHHLETRAPTRWSM
jgi:hypothetical protein